MKKTILLLIILAPVLQPATAQTYKIVDTGQSICYDSLMSIQSPAPGEPFFGQDAQYNGYQPAYQDNGDGTVTDLVTGLMWQKSPDMNGDGTLDYSDKLSFADAAAAADTFSLAGYTDWRLPTIKELYSLILFSGTDPSGPARRAMPIPFIDTNYFDFAYGDTTAGERLIDAQYWSSTKYVGATMNNDSTTFGVNFGDGRIKGYPSQLTGPPGMETLKLCNVRYVRGAGNYGINAFNDNGDGTVTDEATGLMWTKDDSGDGMKWQDALAWVVQKNQENFQGYNDWRLPNAKELQSIVDYSRAPAVTGSAAIDPVFNVTSITDEGGNLNYPFFWTGTTHASSNGMGQFAVYVAFGQALGWMEAPPGSGNMVLWDVHGAGAQRSDPKFGDPDNYPYGHGPQGDVVRIFNFVRLVRDASSAGTGQLDRKDDILIYPNPAHDRLNIRVTGNVPVSSTIAIMNMLGQTIYFNNDNLSSQTEINLANIEAGMYILQIKNNDLFYSGKFLVN